MKTARSRTAGLLLVAATLTLAWGLFLPLLYVEKWFWDSQYSVVSGIAGLWEDGELLLAFVLLCFSVVFPIAKLGVLWRLWFRPVPREQHERWLARLEMLGRWSMLDVFAVAILVVAAKLGVLASVEPRAGVYVFGAAVLLSMAATSAVRRAGPASAPLELAPVATTAAAPPTEPQSSKSPPF